MHLPRVPFSHVLAFAAGTLLGFAIVFHAGTSKRASGTTRSDGVPSGTNNAGTRTMNNDRTNNGGTTTTNINETNGEPRIFCLVLTSPENVRARAVHARDTWTRRCDGRAFYSSSPDPSLPAVPLPVADGWENLWAKTNAAFRDAHRRRGGAADWFLKTDDDTYVVVDNLRRLLRGRRGDEYVGRHFAAAGDVEQGYMSGGAGYALSAGALGRFAREGAAACLRADTPANEDVEMGRCMERLGVAAADSRDERARETFFPFAPEFHVASRRAASRHPEFWFWNNRTYYPLVEGAEGMSEAAVSFHYVKPNRMYLLDYLIYKLQVHGLSRDDAT
ncbi:PREDICTED: glycoprotein-N-acetylgalactosamine 3-beta-galactosyltransferase 1-like [Priapulus caudatus]|uniref:N-acetylgalactosaminide beta-1,3-galactosyltransferase n=1 Tax=Priapulus caudatus TaxID=37621 RepID=A0ABM1EDB3_PRICU|nr:PREDICTED: glycoprotein-N-acetylgalactosamine 3-beta-galactosyltransferase 1-like [Priapulus caudatus]